MLQSTLVTSPMLQTLVLSLVVVAPHHCLGQYEGPQPLQNTEGDNLNPLRQRQDSENLLNTSLPERDTCCCAKAIDRAVEVLDGFMNTLTSLLNKNATTNTVAPCPYPFTQVIYECFYAHQKKLTWPQARRVCQGMGGDLANPEHPFALQTYLADTYGPGYFWVGGTDVGAEGTWQWVSDRPVDPEEWLFSRPDNRAGDEHCLEIVMSDYPGLYNDETCSIAQRFICQYRH